MSVRWDQLAGAFAPDDPLFWLAIAAWIAFLALCARVVQRNAELAGRIDEAHPHLWPQYPPGQPTRRRAVLVASFVMGETPGAEMRQDARSQELLGRARDAAFWCFIAFVVALCLSMLIGNFHRFMGWA